MAQLQQAYVPQCGLQYNVVHCRHDKRNLLGVCRTSKVCVHSLIRVLNCQTLELLHQEPRSAVIVTAAYT